MIECFLSTIQKRAFKGRISLIFFSGKFIRIFRFTMVKCVWNIIITRIVSLIYVFLRMDAMSLRFNTVTFTRMVGTLQKNTAKRRKKSECTVFLCGYFCFLSFDLLYLFTVNNKVSENTRANMKQMEECTTSWETHSH